MVINISGFSVYVLTFIRLVSMIAFNPIFNRRNVSAQIRIGLSLVLTLLVAPTINFTDDYANIDFHFIVLVFKQVFVGYCLGFVFQIFYYMLFFVGDFLDMQFGMSFSKILDPGINLQLSITGTFFNIIFVLYFFITNSHLTMIKIFADSFQFMPFNYSFLNKDFLHLLVNIFTACFVMMIKLALPFILVEFIVEISMGILMKLIPQVHVFVINVQVKILVAYILLFTFSPIIAEFIDKYIFLMLDNTANVLVG